MMKKTKIAFLGILTSFFLSNMLLAQQPDWYSTFWPHEEGINYDEPYRGQFHFSPMSGWMNDINMLVYFNGIYHMTYQADHDSVRGDEEEMLCQAYATSPDLIHWTDRGYALIPNNGVSGNIDAEHVFSGSGVVVSDSTALRITGSSDSAMVAIFTGVGRGTCLAWSNDSGKTWNEYEGNPVANLTDSEDPRDPCVIWYEPELKWVMAIFEDGTTFYESENLIDWNYLSNLDFGHECPDFFELPLDGDPTNKKWVLQDALGTYLVGEFDGITFLQEEGPYVMDQGPDFYAAQTFFRNTLPDEKLIQIAWLDTWNKSINTATWEHEATIPVELDLITYKGKMILKRTPVPALSSIYEETVSWEELSISPGSNIFDGIYSKKMDIIAEFDLTDATASEIQFQIANKTISYHIDSEKLTTSPEHIDYQEMLAKGPRSDTLGRLSNNRLKLRILADWGQLEIFGNDGVFSYSEQFAFSPNDSTLSLTTVGGDVKLVSMGFNEVARIWNDSPQTMKVVYVDARSSSQQDGNSWETAYNNMQDAVDKAKKGGEIWVAAGTYKPTKQFGGEGDRYRSFRLKENVRLYGGFNGSETSREERNWNVNKTILSGDLNGDDNDFDNNTENSYHVVTGSGLDSTAVLDGFYIMAGNANNSVWPNDGGGGMTNFDGSPTISNCTFNGNAAFADGGGIRNWGNSKPVIKNCIFRNNRVVQEGGGIMNGPGSKATIINCRFLHNYAGEDGGGMYNNESYTMVTNCVFQNNSSGLTGGGMYNVNSSNTLITNCTFFRNSADVQGGALSNRESNPELVNCILWNNYAPEYPEIFNQESTSKITFSLVKGGYIGIGNIDSDPLFADKWLRLFANSPCIDAGNNQAVPQGVDHDLDASPRIKNGIVDMGAYEFLK